MIKNIPSIGDFHNYKSAVITQADGDMGDGMQRTAMYLIGQSMLDNEDWQTFENAVMTLQPPFKRPVRDPIKWNDPNDVSRDQEDPWTIMLYVYGIRYKARELISTRYKRFGLYPNKDVTGPVQLTCDIRMSLHTWAYPLLYILDFAFVVSALIDCAKAKIYYMKDGSWLDMDNSITRVAFAYKVRPTFWIKQTIEIYDKLFPNNLGGQGIIGALRWKHRESAGANPAMARLWEMVWQSIT